MENIKCPKCNSTQLSANKKGFSGKNAIAGMVLTGGVGFLAGTIGSNKVIITCLKCGYQFKAGEYDYEIEKARKKRQIESELHNGKRSFFPAVIMGIFTITGSLMSYMLLDSELIFLGIIFLIATILCLIVSVIFFFTEIKKSIPTTTIKKSNNADIKAYVFDNIIYIRNIGDAPARNIILTFPEINNENSGIKITENKSFPFPILNPRDAFEIKFQLEKEHISSPKIIITWDEELEKGKCREQILNIKHKV